MGATANLRGNNRRMHLSSSPVEDTTMFSFEEDQRDNGFDKRGFPLNSSHLNTCEKSKIGIPINKETRSAYNANIHSGSNDFNLMKNAMKPTELMELRAKMKPKSYLRTQLQLAEAEGAADEMDSRSEALVRLARQMPSSQTHSMHSPSFDDIEEEDDDDDADDDDDNDEAITSSDDDHTSYSCHCCIGSQHPHMVATHCNHSSSSHVGNPDCEWCNHDLEVSPMQVRDASSPVLSKYLCHRRSRRHRASMTSQYSRRRSPLATLSRSLPSMLSLPHHEMFNKMKRSKASPKDIAFADMMGRHVALLNDKEKNPTSVTSPSSENDFSNTSFDHQRKRSFGSSIFQGIIPYKRSRLSDNVSLVNTNGELHDAVDAYRSRGERFRMKTQQVPAHAFAQAQAMAQAQTFGSVPAPSSPSVVVSAGPNTNDHGIVNTNRSSSSEYTSSSPIDIAPSSSSSLSLSPNVALALALRNERRERSAEHAQLSSIDLGRMSINE